MGLGWFLRDGAGMVPAGWGWSGSCGMGLEWFLRDGVGVVPAGWDWGGSCRDGTGVVPAQMGLDAVSCGMGCSKLVQCLWTGLEMVPDVGWGCSGGMITLRSESPRSSWLWDVSERV